MPNVVALTCRAVCTVCARAPSLDLIINLAILLLAYDKIQQIS